MDVIGSKAWQLADVGEISLMCYLWLSKILGQSRHEMSLIKIRRSIHVAFTFIATNLYKGLHHSVISYLMSYACKVCI